MWGLMHLIKNPEVLRKIRTELNTVTGGNRSISLSDRDHTQYLNWTILVNYLEFVSVDVKKYLQ
ncbi:hypothetical protein OSTOST_18549, partial [Ostertagia ostertagi]